MKLTAAYPAYYSYSKAGRSVVSRRVRERLPRRPKHIRAIGRKYICHFSFGFSMSSFRILDGQFPTKDPAKSLVFMKRGEVILQNK